MKIDWMDPTMDGLCCCNLIHKKARAEINYIDIFHLLVVLNSISRRVQSMVRQNVSESLRSKCFENAPFAIFSPLPQKGALHTLFRPWMQFLLHETRKRPYYEERMPSVHIPLDPEDWEQRVGAQRIPKITTLGCFIMKISREG